LIQLLNPYDPLISANFFEPHSAARLPKKNLSGKDLAGELRDGTRPPGQEEGSGRDRPTRGLWDSLSFVVWYRAKEMPKVYFLSYFYFVSGTIKPSSKKNNIISVSYDH